MTAPRSALAVGGLLLLGLVSCRPSPCAPWTTWGLAELADAPGERLEMCTAQHMRWRVMPGGTREAWLDELARYPRNGWRVWRRDVLVKQGEPAVLVDVRVDRADLVIELTPDPSLDVRTALDSLRGP